MTCLTLIQGDGESTGSKDPWDQANLELIPDASVVPPGMRLSRGAEDDWLIKTKSGRDVLYDYSAMSAVTKAWSVYAAITSDVCVDNNLPKDVSISQVDENTWEVEFTRNGYVLALPEFRGKNNALAYVQQLVADVGSEDPYHTASTSYDDEISLPEGFRLVEEKIDDAYYYRLLVAGHKVDVCVSVELCVNLKETVEEIANNLRSDIVDDCVKVVRSTMGAYIIEYGSYSSQLQLSIAGEFDTHDEACRAVKDIKRAVKR